jgi:hypothetical protein
MVGFFFVSAGLETMKIAHSALIVLFTCALGGCEQPASDTGPESVSDTPQATSELRRSTAPLDKAQVLASGKTGFWSVEGNEVCRGSRSRMTLAWNVQDATRAKVVVWMDPNGRSKERAIKSGTAVGAFTTGPWVTPGAVFVLREGETRRELGRMTAGGKQC